MKIQLELQTNSGRRPLKTLDVKSIPRVGEFIETVEGTLEVVAIVHTPVIRDYEALVVLRNRGNGKRQL